MTDFSKTKIHCSSLSVLFTEPQSKADKEAGELSKTAKAHLVEVYIREVWGRYEDITSKQIQKGNLAEEEIITLLGFIDNKPYVKNEERKENEWIIGTADIVDEIIIDAKSSWSAKSFIPKILEPLDKDYFYQMQGYLWLWDIKIGRVSYALVNCPESILQNERRKLLFNMNVATEESPEYLEAVKELEKNHIFDDVPLEQRIFNIEIERDENIIRQIPAKVEKAREYLSFIQSKHLKSKI